MTNHDDNRQLQRSARLWADFCGTNYTTALRQLQSPLASGILGPAVSPELLLAALDRIPTLGEYGLNADEPLTERSGSPRADLFLGVALSVEVLRMFTPTKTPTVGSYSLKHTAERFLRPAMPYVTNGQMIWAAAIIGLPMSDSDGGPNAQIGISRFEYDYVWRVLNRENDSPRAHQHRPPGMSRLQRALEQVAADGSIGSLPPMDVHRADVHPFHTWMLDQTARRDVIGDLARDYKEGYEQSDHIAVKSPKQLRKMLVSLGAWQPAIDAADAAAEEWALNR